MGNGEDDGWRLRREVSGDECHLPENLDEDEDSGGDECLHSLKPKTEMRRAVTWGFD